MNELMSFEYGAAQVRTQMIDGEPWFVAKDACLILDITWCGFKTLDGLDVDEKLVGNLPTSFGRKDTFLISEAGLYTLLVRSNKPQAKPFRRWVTHEVLPTIR